MRRETGESAGIESRDRKGAFLSGCTLLGLHNPRTSAENGEPRPQGSEPGGLRTLFAPHTPRGGIERTDNG